MALFEPDRPTVHIPIYGSDQIADVTGAGDTVIATMTLALAVGSSFVEAARLANYAGGLVVMKRGTATVSAEELRNAVAEPIVAEKIVTRERSDRAGPRGSARGLHDRVRQRLLRSPARRPHPVSPGRRRGSRSPDRGGERRCDGRAQGAGRPILKAADRAELVAALRGVDYVTVFPEPTVTPLLELLQPDVHCKGTDYTVESVPERDTVLRLRRPHRHRRRSQGSFDARSARSNPRMNILIVRLGALGDIVHAVPAAAALRRAFPDARIDWLVDAKHRAMVDLVTVVDRAIVLERPSVAAMAGRGAHGCGAVRYDARSTFRG